MRYKIIIPSFILLLILSVFTVAYENVGSNRTDFTIYDNSRWGSGQTYSLVSSPLTTPIGVPLALDLDGNGDTEIIAQDGVIVKIFHNSTLVPTHTYTMASGVTYAPLYTYDIDGDGLKEIITAGSDKQIRIIGYNESALYNKSQFTMTTDPRTVFETLIGCRAVNECMAAYLQDTASGNYKLSATYFSNTGTLGIQNNLSIASTSDTVDLGIYCFPLVATMSSENYNVDGSTEFIFSVSRQTIGGGGPTLSSLEIFYLNTLTNSSPYVQRKITDTHPVQATSISCATSRTGQFVSSPLVFDYDNIPSNGLETLIGSRGAINSYNILLFDANGNKLNTYALFGTSSFPVGMLSPEGNYISNLARGNFFIQSGNYRDVCIMAMNPTLSPQRMTGMCVTGTSLPFTFNTCSVELRNPPYNITPTYSLTNPANFMIHSIFGNRTLLTNGNIASTEVLPSSNVLTSLLTPFGSFPIRCDSLWGGSVSDVFGTNMTSLDFRFPFSGNVSAILSDTQQVGYADIIALSNSNLRYIDDGFSNSPGTITGVEINPCVTSQWAVNTTFTISVTVSDFDGDQISANASIYFGDANQFDYTEQQNFPSGTTFTFGNPMTANKTVSNGVIRISGRDMSKANNQSYDVILYPFSVGNDGVRFNDCKTKENFTLISGGVGAVAPTTTTRPPNIIDVGVDLVGDSTGLSSTIIWLGLMTIVTVLTFFGSAEAFGKANSVGLSFAVVAIVDILLLIIGTLLGFLHIGIVISLVVICLAIIGIFVSRHFTGTSKGG